MLQKNVRYKWLSFSNEQFFHPTTPSHVILDDFAMSVSYDTDSVDVANYHGVKSYATRAKECIYTISGRIASTQADNRQDGLDYIRSVIRPEWILGKSSEYLLEWEDFKGRSFFTTARVNSPVSISHETLSAYVNFSFELQSDYPAHFGEHHSITFTPQMQAFGLFSGDSDWVHLGYLPDGGQIWGGISITNAGNFEAWVRITDTSGAEWVFYINNTNGLRYGVSGVSNQRVIDTQVRPSIVTDYGIDSSKNRMRGSTGFLLSPWENIINAIVSQYDFSNPPENNSITLEWYDTYTP